MKVTRIPFSDVPQFSQKDKDYVLEKDELKPFFKHAVNIDSFPKIIQLKAKKPVNRLILVRALEEQYRQMSTSDLVLDNIKALGEQNTFTITTAHQPSLFTGPLYYIYKIISTINLTRQLNKKYPRFNFVPVFVSGAEDHDFEEINHAHIFGKTLLWENSEEGAVGTMNLESLPPTLSQLIGMLGTGENAEQLSAILKTAYEGNHRYGRAAFLLVNALFKDYGLVILDMNTPILKKAFIPYIKEELKKQISKSIVTQTQQELEAIGFGKQTYVRDINFFHLHHQRRDRIEKDGDKYRVLNTDLSFSEKEMMIYIDQYPERFSPNVVMRPIYQELILPNLAYIGGGGEIAYWLERKKQFEYWDIPFPMLIRRNTVLWVNTNEGKKIKKLGFTVPDLFSPSSILTKKFVTAKSKQKLTLEEEKEKLSALFFHIREKAKQIDAGLESFISAENSRQLKALNNIESRLHKAEKQKHEVAINQLIKLKEKLFPGNGLQERYDNFIPFYLKYGEAFFTTLLAQLNPLEKGLIIVENE